MPKRSKRGEDRQKFRDAMDRIGLESPRSAIVHSMEEAAEALESVGLPAVIRPSFRLAERGAESPTTAKNMNSLSDPALKRADHRSPDRRKPGRCGRNMRWRSCATAPYNAIIICSIETSTRWASIPATASPSPRGADSDPTRNISACARHRSPCCGKSASKNWRFQRPVRGQSQGRPDGRDQRRTRAWSRSSAQASKAHRLPDRQCRCAASGLATRSMKSPTTSPAVATPASFEPTIDYVVTKIRRFGFREVQGRRGRTVDVDEIGRRSDGRSAAASPKACKRLCAGCETGLCGLDRVRELERGPTLPQSRARWRGPTPTGLLVRRRSASPGFTTVERIKQIAGFDPWFLERLREIVEAEAQGADGSACPADARGCSGSRPWAFPTASGAARAAFDRGRPRDERTRRRAGPAWCMTRSRR